MAIAAAHARILSLTMYKSDLEFRLQSISQQKMKLSYQMIEFANDNADFSTDSRVLQAQTLDEALDLEMKNLETQLKAANQEIESVEKLEENNIKKEYQINFGS